MVRIVDIRHMSVPLEGAVANAVVDFSKHDVSLVAVVSDQYVDGRQVVGFAFNSIGRYAQSGLLSERFVDRLLHAAQDGVLASDGRTFDTSVVAELLMKDEKPGGHGDRAAAAAAIELAVWDLNAKLRGEPAAQTIARAFGLPAERPAVPVYAAGGYYHGEDDGARRLVSEVAEYRDSGYDGFKIKIGGAPLGVDLQRLEAVISVVGDSRKVAVDANGRFDLPTAMVYARELSSYDLAWFEEPGDPLDYLLNAAVNESYPGRVATGENLFSRSDVVNLLRYGGTRPHSSIFQMDAGLSYGLTEYGRMLDEVFSYGHDRSQVCPHGGTLINLHIVHGLQLAGCEAYPGVFRPFGGYAASIEVEQGTIRPSDAPGFGLEEKRDLLPYLDRLVT